MHAAVRIVVLALALSFPATAFADRAAPDILRDKHGRIARSTTAKTAFKHLQPCPATGLSYGRCPGYIIDHIVALKRGGPDAPTNMQWQTVADAKAKDRWE